MAVLNLSKIAKMGARVFLTGWVGAASDSKSVEAALAMDLVPHPGGGVTMVYLFLPKLMFLCNFMAKVRLNIVSSLALLDNIVIAALLMQLLLLVVLDVANCCLLFSYLWKVPN
jgi:hypothetical protein